MSVISLILILIPAKLLPALRSMIVVLLVWIVCPWGLAAGHALTVAAPTVAASVGSLQSVLVLSGFSVDFLRKYQHIRA